MQTIYHICLVITLLLTGGGGVHAQKVIITEDGKIWVTRDPSTGLPSFPMDEIRVQPVPANASKKEQRQYARDLKRANKLRSDVRKVYPLAKLVGKILNDTQEKLATMDSEADKTRYMKTLEKRLKEEYEPQVRRLTMSQGRILIKLVFRETNDTAFNLLKDYRNGATAFFWQTVAKFFGANLKNAYDPTGEDVNIEIIVRQIETGEDRYYY